MSEPVAGMGDLNEAAPLGPAGVRRRMQEIQAKLEALNPSNAAPSKDGSFSSVLSGAIGPNGSVADGESTTPLSPFTPVSEETNPIYDLAGQIAARHGLDPSLFQSLIQEESSGNPNIKPSPKGAIGLAQLMPSTAAELGVKDINDPVQNLEGGATFLAKLMQKYADPSLALAAYNAGPGAVVKAGGVPNNPAIQKYISDINRHTAERHASGADGLK